MTAFESAKIASGGSRNNGAERKTAELRPGPWDGCEKFSTRAERLCLNGRLGRIGVGQWGRLVEAHKHMTDADLLATTDHLERTGMRFRPTSNVRPMSSAEIGAILAQLRDPSIQCQGREALIRIGNGFLYQAQAEGR